MLARASVLGWHDHPSEMRALKEFLNWDCSGEHSCRRSDPRDAFTDDLELAYGMGEKSFGVRAVSERKLVRIVVRIPEIQLTMTNSVCCASAIRLSVLLAVDDQDFSCEYHSTCSILCS